jgi:hypothetical protein
MQRMRRKKSKVLVRAAAGVAALLFIQSCSSSAQVASNLYHDAQAAEANRDLNKAEQLYSSCVSASLDARSEGYQLAALNRLTELQKQLNNPSKAKSYMNKAATLAENVKEHSESSESNRKRQGVSLAKEQHEALMRLADWEFEDGNYISSRKLYEKAAALEPQLNILPDSNYSAATRINRLETRSQLEHEQVKKGMSKNQASAMLRGPQFAERSLDRRKVLDKMNVAMNTYRADGREESARAFLKELETIRTTYGAKEPEYRSALSFGARTFLLHNNPDPIAPFVEADLKLHESFSQAELDNAVPQAVENATSYVQDLVMLAMIRKHQNRFAESLDYCQRAQKLAKQVIPAKSRLDFELSLETAIALEHNNRHAEALPYRRHVLEIYNLYDKDMNSYANQMSSIGTDLFANNLIVESEAAFKEAVKLKRKQKNPENLSHTLHAYADTLIKTGKYAEARKILIESLPYSQKDGKSQQIYNYTLLISACRDINPTEAVMYGKKSLEEMRRYGTFNQDFMIAQNCVGVAEIEMRMGKYKDAVKTLDEGVEWQLAHGKELSAFTAGMLNLKAAALHALGKYDEEEKCRLRSVDICRRFSPPQPDPLASTLFQTAARLQQREKFEQAEKLYKEAIAIGAKENDIAYKQVQLQCLAALGEIAILYRKDTKLAENYKAQLVPTYKKYLRNVTHADISLCLTIGDLCFMLKDKKNLQTLLDTAQSAYDKDPQKRPEQLEKLQRHRKTYNTLLK